MPSPEAQIKKLEKKIASLEKALAKEQSKVKDLESDYATVVKWIKREVAWSQQVTKMLREIDWSALKYDYPGGGGTNPPQKPPLWPPN